MSRRKPIADVSAFLAGEHANQPAPVPREHRDVPTVEARIYSAQKNVALFLMLFEALSQADDMQMTNREREDAWARVIHLANDTRADLVAVYRALHAMQPRSGLLTPAPDVTEDNS